MRLHRAVVAPGIAVCVMVLGLSLASVLLGDAAANVEAARPTSSDQIDRQAVRAVLSISPMVPAEPFGRVAETTPEGPLWAKWRTLTDDLARDTAVLARCREDMAGCPDEARRLITIIETARSKSGRALLGEVNRAVNLAIRPVSDLAQHGVTDRWSAPLATFASGYGDCEDYAIAKYVALREAGIAEDDLRLVIVADQRAHGDHAVLAVRQDDNWLVLDNRHFNLVDAGDVPNIVPLFTLSANGVQTFAVTDAAVTDAARTRPLRVAVGQS